MKTQLSVISRYVTTMIPSFDAYSMTTSILNKSPLLPKPDQAIASSRSKQSSVDFTSKVPTKSRPNQIWLSAFTDSLANCHAFTPNIITADTNNDADYKLLIADITDKKLKLYKNTTLHAEYALLDNPIAICTFYTDTKQPAIPSIAVAAGTYIFIYRNLRPYYKFTLPNIDVDENEVKIWNDSKQVTTPHTTYTQLRQLHHNGTALSTRSISLLALSGVEDQMRFIDVNRQLPLVQCTSITCMTTLNQSMHVPRAVSMLVVGTEHKQIYIMDCTGTSVLQKFQLPSVPAYIAIDGLYDIDYRIVVSCRNGRVYTIKNNKLLSAVIEVEAQPVAVAIVDKAVVVACSDSTIHAFHFKGKKQYTIYLYQYGAVQCMAVMKYKLQRCLIVTTVKGDLLVYNSKYLINASKASVSQPIDVVTGMYVGMYGREDNCLICVHQTGALSVKILQRSANLDVQAEVGKLGAPAEQDVPLPVPKKTRLYVEQTRREVDQAVEMHRVYQRDVCALRLMTAKSYVSVLTKQFGPVSSNSNVKLDCCVQGLGPLMRLRLTLQNTGTVVLYDLMLTYTYNLKVYKLAVPVHHVSVLIPGQDAYVNCDVQCVDANGTADTIRVFVCHTDSTAGSKNIPLIAAIVNMPASEPVVD